MEGKQIKQLSFVGFSADCVTMASVAVTFVVECSCTEHGRGATDWTVAAAGSCFTAQVLVNSTSGKEENNFGHHSSRKRTILAWPRFEIQSYPQNFFTFVK